LATISFGQGISTTSIQVAAALSAVGNGGVLMKPQLVKEIQDKNGNIIKEFPPKKIRTVLSPHTCELVKKILEEVVEPEATGLGADISGYKVAGKTGTAQKVDRATGTYSKSKYTSSFIGFVPASHPEIVISVVIDEPEGLGYGGVVAAPLFSSIGRQTLVYLGILPRKPSRINKKRILITEIEKEKKSELKIVKDNKKFLMPDFTGMTKRQVLKTIDKYKIEVKITGSGTVIGQNPSPGGYLPKDRAGWIILRPPV
jgi:cell division protein FtsI (penicillin-binding protein 3)